MRATRKAALVKLAAFDPRFGHPKTYIDFSSGLHRSSRTDLLGNAVRADHFRVDAAA